MRLFSESLSRDSVGRAEEDRPPPSRGGTPPGCVQLTILRLLVQPQRHLWGFSDSRVRLCSRVQRKDGEGELRPYPARAVHGPGRSGPGHLLGTLGRVCPHLGAHQSLAAILRSEGEVMAPNGQPRVEATVVPIGENEEKNAPSGLWQGVRQLAEDFSPKNHRPGRSFRSRPANLAGRARRKESS